MNRVPAATRARLRPACARRARYSVETCEPAAASVIENVGPAVAWERFNRGWTN